ncbi:hypothetical protein JNK13_02445 [bacterium]|nr:hypothetical protein [bacterium]
MNKIKISSYLLRLTLVCFGLALSFHTNTLAEEAPKIRNVIIQIRDIFDDPGVELIYRKVNDIKISTREKIVRRELLFKAGDGYDQFLIDESIRALRSLSFLREVHINTTPVDNPIGPEKSSGKGTEKLVDIVVSVQDTWTLYPTLGFSSGGGSSKTQIGLLEGNLLGMGKRLEFQYAEDERRKSFAGFYDDPRLFGTKRELELGYTNRSDGYRGLFHLADPFRTLVNKNAWTIDSDISDLVGKLYSAGNERFIFRNKHTEFGGKYVISKGDPEVELHRFSFGYQYEQDDFTQADAADFEDVTVDPDSVIKDPSLLADDRKYSGPIFGYTQVRPDYLAINYIDRFERVEDFNLGRVLGAQIQFAPEFLDSTESALIPILNYAQGLRFSASSFVRGELGLSTRIDADGLANSYIRNQLRFYDYLGPKNLFGYYVGRHTLAAGLNLEYGSDFDRDRELYLGAENGLRGYEDKTFYGDKRLIINLEERAHLVEDLFRLINIGTVAFIDAGGVTDENFFSLVGDNFYGNVGVGLRVGFPRSTGGSIVRIDLAFPWRDGPDDSNAWEPRVFVSTGQTFKSLLDSEIFGAPHANLIEHDR